MRSHDPRVMCRGRRARATWALLLGALVLAGGTSVAGRAFADNGVGGQGVGPLREPRPLDGPSSLAHIGEQQLGRLPWDVHIVRANLSRVRPTAIAAAYLMEEDLLCVSSTGLVYCMSRRDLTPRWVVSLKSQLAGVPTEGPLHYAFLVKAPDGAYWVHAFSKRSGGEVVGFPARLPFAVSSGIDANASYVFMGSLGSPGKSRTMQGVNLIDGKLSWSAYTPGLVWASPAVSADGTQVVVASEDGTVQALSGSATAEGPIWATSVTGAVTANLVVTPEHVLVASQDGLVRCLDQSSGGAMWLAGLDAPFRDRNSLWVLGRSVRELRPSPVEDARPIEVRTFRGLAFARNRLGLFAMNLRDGTRLFHDPAARRPVCRNAQWVVTVDGERRLTLRDAREGYRPKGQLWLRMFDLMPTNTTDGTIFGVTADGYVVAAIPASQVYPGR